MLMQICPFPSSFFHDSFQLFLIIFLFFFVFLPPSLSLSLNSPSQAWWRAYSSLLHNHISAGLAAMGLNLEELRPITPIRVAPNLINPTAAAAAGLKELQHSEEECRTPKSDDHLLRPPPVCPPAPRKPRPPKRKAAAGAPREFFQVTCDLSSIFMLLSHPSSKKLRSL